MFEIIYQRFVTVEITRDGSFFDISNIVNYVESAHVSLMICDLVSSNKMGEK